MLKWLSGIMQLTTEYTEKHIENKRETISFYNFLCALFYAGLSLNFFQKYTTRTQRIAWK